MILTATSFQAQSVHLQAKKIMEWISAELRFRCVTKSVYHVVNFSSPCTMYTYTIYSRVCCVHCGNEIEVT